LTKKEKTGFFLLCSKQAKINALIFLVFYCNSSILTATGWGLSAVSKGGDLPPFQFVEKEGETRLCPPGVDPPSINALFSRA
jgi:hypothetical protein